MRPILRFTCIVVGLAIALAPAAVAYAQAYPRAGWEAPLTTYFHGVSGTATIIDEDTFRVDSFNFDGGGPAVYFYLAADETNAAIGSGLQTGPALDGITHSGETLIIDLPSGNTLDGYNSVAVWCEVFNVNFGSGTFAPVAIPAPSAAWAGLGLLGGAANVAARRRARRKAA